MKKDHNYYIRLKVTHSIVIIVLAVTSMLVVGWNAAEYYKRSILENITVSARRSAENCEEEISRFLKNKTDLLLSLVKMFPLEHFRKQENLERIFAAFSANNIIVDLGIIDAAGQHLAYVGPYKGKLVDKNYADTEWFHEVMLNGSYISDIFTGYRGVPHLIVAVTDPLKTWILRATINSERFNSLLSSIRIGPAADSYIVNMKGDFQTPNRDNKERLGAEEFELLNKYHDSTLVQTIGDAFYVTTWFNEGKWMLILKLDINTLLNTFYEARHINFLVGFVQTFFIVTIAILMVNFLINRVEAAVVSKEAIDNQMSQVEKMALIGRLAASVAHEVNNPLQMIGDQAGWIEELIAEEEPTNIKNLTEYQSAINKIQHHVKRAAKVTHRLLGFSRKMEMDKAKVDINAILEETLSFFSSEAIYNNIKILKNLPPDLPATMTDAYQLQQVFFNIINNAFDAMDKNGCLNIETWVEGTRIMIDIGDTGLGIKPEYIKKIFEPFFTTKEQGKGTGLGLSICFNTMQKLGGDITVKNKKEGGTVFTVSVPIVFFGESPSGEEKSPKISNNLQKGAKEGGLQGTGLLPDWSTTDPEG